MDISSKNEVKQLINGIKASDGDGVQLTRLIGSANLMQLDPFLLFDAFGSDQPQDYIGGFPPHPHRGFETVTYMLAGKMRHQDSAGNSGVIEADGVQWMTAGKGIIHSEMPEQEQGLLAGFQLWVNLPAKDKMTEPKYQEKSADDISQEIREGSQLKVVSGTTQQGTQGVIKNDTIAPIYWDIKLTKQHNFSDVIPCTHNAFIYIISGEVIIGDKKTKVQQGQLATLTHADSLSIWANYDSRFLLIAGKPLNEPVERAGPFVMNTREEIEQAFADYQRGEFA
ncbi:MAG: quercetin 2,3-dioxygenase [Gammaproteobacteria bacterium]|nr:MAG: quercetin 2,3-dioxygenase [Gammaproteobacteria bacterium]